MLVKHSVQLSLVDAIHNLHLDLLVDNVPDRVDIDPQDQVQIVDCARIIRTCRKIKSGVELTPEEYSEYLQCCKDIVE